MLECGEKLEDKGRALGESVVNKQQKEQSENSEFKTGKGKLNE